MNIKINSNELLKNLLIAYPIINHHNIIPIHDFFYLSLSDGKLCIIAESTNNSLAVTLDGEGENGSMYVDGRQIVNLLKAIPNEPIQLKKHNDGVTLTTSSGLYNLLTTQHEEDYNWVCAVDDGVSVNVDHLKELVLFKSSDPLKNMLHGIYFNGIGVATDGACLLECGGLVEDGVILHPSVCNLLNDIDYKFSTDNKYAYFFNENVYLKSLLIDAKFPEYNKFIPTHNKEIEVNRTNLLFAVKRSISFTNSVTNEIQLTSNGDVMELHVSDLMKGTSCKEEIKLIKTTADIDIKLSAKYLIKVLNAFNDENILIKFDSNSTPIVIDQENKRALLATLGI